MVARQLQCDRLKKLHTAGSALIARLIRLGAISDELSSGRHVQVPDAAIEHALSFQLVAKDSPWSVLAKSGIVGPCEFAVQLAGGEKVQFISASMK